MDSREFAKYLLTRSLPKDQWTTCHVFRCVMNTGWDAGDDKYKCRIGSDYYKCGALENIRKPIIAMTREEIEGMIRDDYPYNIKTDEYEKWYKLGCMDGLEAADDKPKTAKLWHDERECPNDNMSKYGCGEMCLVISKDGHIDIGQAVFNRIMYAISCGKVVYSMDEIKYWAYVKDLLPKGGKE